MMEEMRILSTTAILGYGFPMESFEEGMKRKPHVIAVDAGSTKNLSTKWLRREYL